MILSRVSIQRPILAMMMNLVLVLFGLMMTGREVQHVNALTALESL